MATKKKVAPAEELQNTQEGGCLYIDPAELTGIITLTPEQRALAHKIAESMAEACEDVTAWLEELKETFSAVWAQACELMSVASKDMNDLMDAMLYEANDNPKWWHLYKHAKKYRTRKKYRRRLILQLLRKQERQTSRRRRA